MFFEKIKIINLKSNLQRLEPCDVLMFCHDGDRGLDLDGKAYSPLMDSLREELEALGYVCQTVAHPWSKLGGEQACGNPVLINFQYFFSKLLYVLKINKNSIFNLYIRIFKKSSPKLVVTIGFNDALCQAAQALDIFHIELLHGIGYDFIPYDWDKKSKLALPQAILSLDEVSTKTFEDFKNKGIQILEVEHLFLKRFKEDQIVKLPDEWKATSSLRNYKKEILISLQWGYAPGIDELPIFSGILENGLIYRELETVIALTKKDILWRLRFHPVQYRQQKKYKKLFDYVAQLMSDYGNCEWEDSTYKPLPSVLRSCAGHITMSSMTSYESAYVGVPTLALCPTLREEGIYKNFFSDLSDASYLEKREATVEGIKDWIHAVERKEPYLQSTSQLRASEVIDTIIKKRTR